MQQFVTVFVMAVLIPIKGNHRCSKDSLTPTYHLMEKCHRSKLSVLAKANYVSLGSCLKFALSRKGLALNFSPPEVLTMLKEGESPPEFTCEVLKCSESENGLSLDDDTRYDYYSLYAKPLRKYLFIYI